MSDSPARPAPSEDLDLIAPAPNSPRGEGEGTPGDVWPEPFCSLLTSCLSASAPHATACCESPRISCTWGKWEPKEQAGLFVRVRLN